jgi:hypothetical protein
VSNVSDTEIFFLKQVKQTLKEEFNLPWECISIERHEETYKMFFIMKKVPFEVYFHRYDILDDVSNHLNLLSKLIMNKQIFFMKVFVDYRDVNKNLLCSI